MMHAPRCGRCAALLHGAALTVRRIKGADGKESRCPWCDRAAADGIYRIRAMEEE